MKIEANGVTFNYRLDGPEDAPWLMLSNSLATNLSMWDGQVAEWAQHYRVLRYDQRGHGESEATAGNYDFDMLADDAAALMTALGIHGWHDGHGPRPQPCGSGQEPDHLQFAR
jgi:3-oxoadipate enol-lactonase